MVYWLLSCFEIGCKLVSRFAFLVSGAQISQNISQPSLFLTPTAKYKFLPLQAVVSRFSLPIPLEIRQFSKAFGHCPGLYCGRTLLDNGNWSACGACPRGFRTNSTHCMPCSDIPEFYDYLFLVFTLLVVLLLHWICIDYTTVKKSFAKEVLVLHFSALIEVSLAAVITTVIVEPLGAFSIRSCKTRRLSDWYTLLHNPSPNYEDTLHCTQEAVYPLYTMVFTFYAMATVNLLVIRPWLTNQFKHGKISIYAALYFYPILALFQAVFGGIIYYTFPYIVIIASLISSAAHFAYKVDQSVSALIISTVTDLRNLVILLGHWLCNAYGIIAVTQLKDPTFHLSLLALVPLPTIFYVVTAKFTDPTKLHVE